MRDPAVHAEVIRTVTDELWDIGYHTAGLTFSPIRGQNGNIEFLGYFRLGDEAGERLSDEQICAVVQEAHAETHK